MKVLVIGASGGIGAALVIAHESRGDQVACLSRSEDHLDLTDQKSVDQCLDGLGPFDRVIVATGALEIGGNGPEKTIKSLSADAMMAQFALNAVGPALVLTHAHRLLPRDKPSQFAVLSARVGSIGDNRLGGWISYRSAKAAVNQIIRTAAIELQRTHPLSCVVAIHPGTVATRFTEKYLARHPADPPHVSTERIRAVLDGLTHQQTGSFFDQHGKPVPW